MVAWTMRRLAATGTGTPRCGRSWCVPATTTTATAFMSLMEIPETERVLAEVFRVLKPGGFFQFSITHPCFDTPHRKNLHDETGYTYAMEVGDYFGGRERSKSGSSSLLPQRSAKD